MKLLTILAVIIGVVCMATFYAGNAHADSLGECMKACKSELGLNCKALTGQARAGCNHDCMIACTPGGAGGGQGCLSDACPAGVDSATGFFDIPNGSMSVCQNFIRGGVGLPWIYSVSADTVAGPGFAGAPAHYECTITLIPGESNVTMLNINRDPVTNCIIDEDTPIDDFKFLADGVLMDWDDVKAVDVDVQIQTCLADAGILVDLNTNPCPVGKDCGCSCGLEIAEGWDLRYDLYIPGGRRCTMDPTNPNSCANFEGGYDPSIDYRHYIFTGDYENPDDCLCMETGPCNAPINTTLCPNVCRDDETDVIVPNGLDICIWGADDKFDDINDVGMYACDGDHFLDLDNDPNTPDDLVIDYNDCIYRVAQGLTEQQKRWAAVLVGLAGSGDPQPMAKLMEDGFIGDLANPPVLYVLEDEVNCGLDQMIDYLKELE